MFLLPHIYLFATLIFTILFEAILGQVDGLHCEEKAVCPSGYFTILNKCFKVVNKDLNWKDAKKECEDVEGSLAIVNDCNLLKPLSKFLQSSAPNSSIIWIGASREKEVNNFTWVDGIKVQMGVPFWGTKEGKEVEELAPFDDNCAQIDPTKQYFFFDANCTKLGTPLCQAKPLRIQKTENCVCNDDTVKRVCPEDFEDVGGSCFYFPASTSNSAETASFEESRNICKNFYPDSYLPILDSCNLFRDLVEFINNNEKYQKLSGYWVNAKRSEGELFIWANGNDLEPGTPFWEKTSEMNLPSTNMNRRCAVMYGANQYYFLDILCELSHSVFPLCQADPILQN